MTVFMLKLAVLNKIGQKMSSKDKKLAVLHQLSLEGVPISLPDLLEKLGSAYAERSVRRYLAEMVNEGLVEKLGHKRGTTYQVIQRANRDIGKAGSCFGLESAEVIEQVRRPIYERYPVAYDDNWFDSYQPNMTFYIPLNSRMQLQKAGEELITGLG